MEKKPLQLFIESMTMEVCVFVHWLVCLSLVFFSLEYICFAHRIQYRIHIYKPTKTTTKQQKKNIEKKIFY